jgi:hypothetical protein
LRKHARNGQVPNWSDRTSLTDMMFSAQTTVPGTPEDQFLIR